MLGLRGRFRVGRLCLGRGLGLWRLLLVELGLLLYVRGLVGPVSSTRGATALLCGILRVQMNELVRNFAMIMQVMRR